MRGDKSLVGLAYKSEDLINEKESSKLKRLIINGCEYV